MLYRKGSGMEAKLCYIGHTLMENRNGLLVDARLTRVSGHAERLAPMVQEAMRGVVFTGGRELELMTFPDPTPEAHEVVIEMKASGMCGL